MRTQTWLKVITAALLLLAPLDSSALNVAHAQQGKPLQWESLNPQEIRESILDNEALSDSQKVAALAHHLDKSIALAPLTPPEILNTTNYEERKMQPGYQYAWLIDRMASRHGKVRPQAIATVLANFNTLSGIKNKQAVRSLLYVALGLAGGDAPESELLRLLNHPNTPQEIVYRILAVMLGSNRPRVGATPEQPYANHLPSLADVRGVPARVPLRALPRLLELVNHPWSYRLPMRGAEDVRVYPIRELAYACLRELGVEAERVVVPEAGTDEGGEPRVSKTIIKVNQRSAAKALREAKRAVGP